MPETEMTYRIATSAMLALATPEILSGLNALQRMDALGRTFRTVFPEARHLRDDILDAHFDNALRDRDLGRAMESARVDYVPTWTRSRYWLSKYLLPQRVEEAIARTRVLAVGAGPGTLINMAPLVHCGLDSHNIVMIDKQGVVGGMWARDPDGAGSAFNNPRLEVQGTEIDGDRDGRSNQVMSHFLHTLGRRIDGTVVEGEVMALQQRSFGRIAELANGETTGLAFGADLTMVSMGNEPLPMHSGKMETNASEFDGKFERWQRPFTGEEALKLDGRKVLIVGLGNSALAQVRFIEEANAIYNVNIKPVVITHFTSRGVWNEDEEMVRADGSVDRLTRDLPGGKTLNLEKDIMGSYERFGRLRRMSTFIRFEDRQQVETYGIEGIVPSVKKCIFSETEDGYAVKITISAEHEGDKGGDYLVDDIGMVFFLCGYGVLPEKLMRMGIQPSGVGKALVRPHDGAVIRDDGSVDASIFVTGFASSDSKYAHSVGTIPGMLGRFPNVAWTAIVGAMTRTV